MNTKGEQHFKLSAREYFVSDFLGLWLSQIEDQKSVELSTIVKYRSDLKTHVIPRIGSYQLRRISPTDIENLYLELFTAGRIRPKRNEPLGLSLNTIRGIAGTLHKAFEDGAKWQLLEGNNRHAIDSLLSNWPKPKSPKSVPIAGPEYPSPQSPSGFAAERVRRIEQLNKLRATGVNPYPYRFDRSDSLAAIRARHAQLAAGSETSDQVAVAGRIMRKRDQGKLIFCTIRDRSGEIQLFISRSVIGSDAFDAVGEFDIGDWVGATGVVMTTRNGELSIKVFAEVFLSKAIRQLPDKWHGLTDIETRYRQRYADLIINEDTRRIFEIRHATISSFRRTFQKHDFIEVETPVLQVESGGANARPFITHHNALNMKLYLRVALELHLKRLIVGGMERVYEIGRVFRNEGTSPRHNPEFTMMESYQAFGDYTEVMALTEELIINAARDATGTTTVSINRENFDLAKPWPRARMIDLASAAVGTLLHPSQSAHELRTIATKHGVKTETHWGSGRIIEEIFAKKAEAALINPTFVTGHPVEISPLARADRDDPFLTERFELFVGAREIANGYTELNDPAEQRRRFEDEQRAKEAGDLEAGSVDEDYLRALEYGMPPTAGLGIGIDRLVMLLSGADSIKDVILFPTLRPEVM